MLFRSTSTPGTGGYGGGGDGGRSDNASPGFEYLNPQIFMGMFGTGGGGGAANNPSAGGRGGSGVILIRYLR